MKKARNRAVTCLTSSQMNDDMTRARSIDGEGGLEARAKPAPSLATSLRQALQGAVFPLSRAQLVLVARENAAPAELLTLMAGLPSQEFRSLEAVEFSLEGSVQDQARAQHEANSDER
jgi:hypothetical protein